MDRKITLNHGSGGRQTNDLIRELFAHSFGMEMPLTDSAIVSFEGGKLAFTTDSYVIDPVFFPGGDIGKLAICGTVNDLAVSGAIPLYISVSFIIEEGFLLDDLKKIVESMAREAVNARVKIVTGDTKVVGKGKCDRIFINTAGTGVLLNKKIDVSTASEVRQGDCLIVNGCLGNHSIAVLGSRNNLSFTTPVQSDCASLNHLTTKLLNQCSGIRFMRDLTRGGLAGVLNELSAMCGLGIEIEENSIPVDEPVRGVCEILGFDPLYLANEGKLLVVAERNEAEKVLNILRSDPLGRNAAVIGEIASVKTGKVILNTLTGGKRIVDMPEGVQLPRIC
jgi:hydrogenase expression/formation protein HypE